MPALDKYFIESENLGTYEQIFENITIIDSHTHVGSDLDGHTLGVSELRKKMKHNDIDKSIIFPLNDPRAGKTFSYPNDRVLKAFKKHPDRFIPFFRLNPNYEWRKEFNKRLSQGFRGLKMHPSSQNFRIYSSSTSKIYELLEKHNLPILLHCGFGVDQIADDLLKVSKSFKNLKIILGHGGFGELDEVIKLLAERPNVFFETSAMRFFDLVELLHHVSYKKIIFGSDVPYYDQTLSLQMLVDSATLTNHSPNQIKMILGGNIEKWLK